MRNTLHRAGRTALLLSLIATAATLIAAALLRSFLAQALIATAFFVGFTLRGALQAYAVRLELERAKAVALARRAELEQLGQDYLGATTHAERVAVRERLRAFLLSLPMLALAACAGPQLAEHDAQMMPPAELEPSDAETVGDAAQPTETVSDAGDVPWLELDGARCAGAWADRTDSSTRFVTHPDTGLCTFSCRWLEPKCNEPWYGDRRCFPVHVAELEQLCGTLGGTCELASDGERYCEASP